MGCSSSSEAHEPKEHKKSSSSSSSDSDKEKKKSGPSGHWKPHRLEAHLHGSDNPDQETNWGDDIWHNWDENELPEIKELTIFYTGYVAGIRVKYRNGQEFEARGSQGDEVSEKTHKLKRGEYITKVIGRVGCWSDELKFYTNFGRTLKGGADGGGECEPEYEGNSYVFGFNFAWHHHLIKTTVLYVDLDKVTGDIAPKP